MSKPIVAWVGGKRRLAKQLLPLFPKHICYVEPFCGGAALFFAKQPSEVEVINDINGDLINLYRVVKHHLEEFIRQFKWMLISREQFDWHKVADTNTLTDIQQAARFYYLQCMTFGAKIDSRNFGTATTSPPSLNLLRMEEYLSAAHLRLSRAFIEHLGWEACIKRYDREHTLFYLDPPYYNTQGYGVEFAFDEYQKIAELARTIKGKMIVSVNDIPEMHQVFDGFDMQQVGLCYTVGGKNRKNANELIIKNF